MKKKKKKKCNHNWIISCWEIYGRDVMDEEEVKVASEAICTKCLKTRKLNLKRFIKDV